MKIGVIEPGVLPDELMGQFPTYPTMFKNLIEKSGVTFEVETISILQGESLPDLSDYDGWAITGSKYGVYEKLDWIDPLINFIQELAYQKKPLIGICFGHQIIAKALGGKVVKSNKGWGVGLHNYSVINQKIFTPNFLESLNLYAFHQDQVIKPPDIAQVWLTSDFCPYAGLSYGDSIISIQPHPEFSKQFETQLIKLLRDEYVPDDVAAVALESIIKERITNLELIANCFSSFYLNNS